MKLSDRMLFDRYFTGLGGFSILFMAAALVVILGPIFYGGMQAVLFRATVEHRRMMLEQFDSGDPASVRSETARALAARQPVFDILKAYEKSLADMDFSARRKAWSKLEEVKDALRHMLGPLPGEEVPSRLHLRYGQTRWPKAQDALQKLLYREEWDYSGGVGVRNLIPRAEDFAGTSLATLFPYVEEHAEEMLRPELTFYYQFWTLESKDMHFFGGIWPEMLGTLYLTIGAMLFSMPMGVMAAIYLVEFAGESRLISILRSCINSLAGVPSIVFGLFGMVFFIHEMRVSDGMSVLAGSLTLATLVLPTIIRASEEALRAVPPSYREAALSLGATKWRTILTVILPAALPGILTGAVISMGRAAGETAPIIFTAAVMTGQVPSLVDTLNHPTLTLPFNIFIIASEHPNAGEIRHVQYGMVLTLVLIVLALNATAIVLRARITKKLRG